MAKQPGVSRGWSALGGELAQASEQALRQAAKDASQRADLGETWGVLMTTVAGTLPDTLASARRHASRMLQAVR